MWMCFYFCCFKLLRQPLSPPTFHCNISVNFGSYYSPTLFSHLHPINIKHFHLSEEAFLTYENLIFFYVNSIQFLIFPRNHLLTPPNKKWELSTLNCWSSIYTFHSFGRCWLAWYLQVVFQLVYFWYPHTDCNHCYHKDSYFFVYLSQSLVYIFKYFKFLVNLYFLVNQTAREC